MPRRDPLATWWAHTVQVSTFVEDDSWGSTWSEPTPALAAIDATTRLVRNPAGAEVVSTATVCLPHTHGFVQPGSKVTLPASHGGRTSTVIACQVADGGGQPTPDHIALHLE